MRLRLGHRNAKHPVLERGSDALVLDAADKSKRPGELAYGALVEPELFVVLGGLSRCFRFLRGRNHGGSGLLSLGLLGCLGLSLNWCSGAWSRGLLRVVLDCGVVPSLAAAFAAGGAYSVVVVIGCDLRVVLRLGGGSRSLSLGMGCWLFVPGLGLVAALNTTTNNKRLRIGKLNHEVLALNPRQLALELIGGLCLEHVEPGLESLHLAMRSSPADGVVMSALLLSLSLLMRRLDFAAVVVAVEVVEEAACRRLLGPDYGSRCAKCGGCEEGDHFRWVVEFCCCCCCVDG
jgi:hypothetical protein